MAESILSWLRYVWDSLCLNVRLSPAKYLIQNAMVLPRLRGVSLRQYRKDDFEACRLLYELNVKKLGVKDSGLNQIFFLHNLPEMTLVAEHEGIIVGCATYVLKSSNYAILALAMVHPDYQRVGVGRLLLFGWIAQMPEIEGMTVLQIFPNKRTFGYFEQYGFEKAAEGWKDATGKEHDYVMQGVNNDIINATRRYLQAAKVPCPDLRHLPPIHQHAVNASMPGEKAGCNTQGYEQ
ncbi:GNAT family N-acetyltransferase [Prosthecobacter sp.]|uniref:GNAT family N-acetyltransferase n=1 Tax=Prosthecobacter sp. TaxID=1965333 RepID=UPI003783E2FE